MSTSPIPPTGSRRPDAIIMVMILCWLGMVAVAVAFMVT